MPARPFSVMEDFLWDSGAHRTPVGPSSTLLEVSLNTRSILQRWRQPEVLQSAGALWGIYSHDYPSQPLTRLLRRAGVREIAGQAAERLVWLGCSISWLHLFEELSNGLPEDRIAINCRPPAHGEKVALSRGDVSSLLAIHMASEAESSSGEFGEPGLWLSRISRAGEFLRRNGGPCVPPVFDSCSGTISPELEICAREQYLAGLKEMSLDMESSEGRLASAELQCPWVAEPLIWRAFLAVWRTDFDLAESLSVRASEVMRQWGTPWDKRLGLTEWLWLLAALRRWIDRDPAIGALPTPQSEDPRDFVQLLRHGAPARAGWLPRCGSRSGGASAARSHGGPAEAMPGKTSRLDRYLHSFQTNQDAPSMPFYPELPSRAWHDPDGFAITHVLKANFDSILREALAIDPQAYHPEVEPIARSGDWDVFLLYAGGRKHEVNCAACPVTAGLIESSAIVKNSDGLAYFSYLSPGTHVAPHRGPTNLRVRCHLGIQIPEGDCHLRVGAGTGTWTRGECLVFDDSLEHEVWNLTDTARIVLVVDLWSPFLSPAEIAVLEGMHRYAYQLATDLNGYWSANEAARSHAGRRPGGTADPRACYIKAV